MYFVTTKHPDYVLFCMTPSERAAIGLTEKNMVHLLTRQRGDAGWKVFCEWSGAAFSHTDLMTSLTLVQEPDDASELTRFLPSALRTKPSPGG